ncbi:hypothetical protein, partial [Mycobacterium avium]|uniref:hypothetical protein n=1 Tax=Mycobacterium avium TaxID=1764 RepID=UPI001F186B9E
VDVVPHVVVGEQKIERHISHCVDQVRAQFVDGVSGRVVDRVRVRVIIIVDRVDVDEGGRDVRCLTTILRDIAMQPNSKTYEPYCGTTYFLHM